MMVRRSFSFAGALVAAVGLGLLPAGPVSGVELVSIPIDQIIYGAEGETVLVASVDVPDEFVGQTCEVTGQTVNQESVHDNNDLLITTGGQTITIANFEDEGFIVHDGSDIEAISDTIDVFVRFGPDGVSSGGFVVDVNCDIEIEPETPDTSTPEPTTTQPPTTAPPTTEPATTAPPPSGPTVPETTAPETTAVPGTDTPTTAPPPLPPDQQPELPITGTETLLIALVGVFIALAGYSTIEWARNRTIKLG